MRGVYVEAFEVAVIEYAVEVEVLCFEVLA